MCGGLFHTVVAALMRYEVWAQIADEGFLNTVTLDPSAAPSSPTAGRA